MEIYIGTPIYIIYRQMNFDTENSSTAKKQDLLEMFFFHLS